MTIAISTKIGEGLVYAADSTSSYFETFETASGPQSRLVQSFHHARKLIQLRDYPIGILTYGLGQIGTRNLESLVAEFETTLPEGLTINVEQLARGLHAFVQTRYDAAFAPPAPTLPGTDPVPDTRPGMGIVVGGFSSGTYRPDEWSITFPPGAVEQVRTVDGDFGARWWGITAPLMRLIAGVDPAIGQWLIRNGIEPDQAQAMVLELIQEFRWPIVFDGMPVQDAIDLVVFLANVAIGHSRFVVGPPVCGGPLDVAVITHRGFTWVRRKELDVKTDSIFF